MNGIRPIFVGLALAWWKWALREMPPTHRDVPYVVLQIARLEGNRACKAS